MGDIIELHERLSRVESALEVLWVTLQEKGILEKPKQKEE